MQHRSLTRDLSEIDTLERLYAVLSHVNRAVVHAKTRDGLFHAVCEALVHHGGFGLAWVGWVDPTSLRLVPVAHVGDENGYLDAIEIIVDDGPLGRGPSGVAIREGRPCVSNDLLAAPAISPWRAELERRGLRAAMAIPVRTGTAVCGSLNVYAHQEGFFRDREIALLTQAGADLSFGLDNLAREDERRRTEASLRRLSAIIESTDDAIIGLALTGEITSVNVAAQRMFGFTADELVGCSSDIVVPPELVEERNVILARIARGEHVANFETTRRRKDGTRFAASVTYSPILDSEDRTEIVGISKIVRDITPRREAELEARRERDFASSVIEAMPGLLCLYDEEGRFLRWNRELERESGYAASEIRQMTPSDFFGAADRELVRAKVAETLAHGEASLEASFVARDGTATPYFFTGKRTTFDGRTSVIGVGVDVSERKRAERALRELNESLEAKVRA
ncbi:MAG TPA: PAS domain S-box protein, partial [Polyangiaceae bacterium]|nr:PAS domain S-box protein [Polyangiaceae bacterium]